MVAKLAELRARGQGVIESLSSIQLETLLEVQKRLSALNGRRQRAFRVPSPDLAARFLVSDFLGTDQAQTTGSVRIDSASATLRERAESGQINIKSTRFSTSWGTIQKAGGLYQVSSDSPPVGTFDLELDPPLNLSLLSFDMVSTPSTPEVSVGVSENGVTFAPASSIALNGYRINAWLVPQTVRFVRLTINPTHPDTLGGSVYTFGLTSVSGWTIDFHLRSEWVSKPVLARPHSLFWKFLADSDPGLSYFLSLGTQAAQQVSPGDGALALHRRVVTIRFRCRLSL